MNSTAEPRLAPPGAGLPGIELRIARWQFALRRWMGNRKTFTAAFQKERARIRALIDSSSPKYASERVLIKRLPGLEDSSRYWSVWMTLDHLRIVNTGILRTINLLTRGEAPPGKGSTAAVKPNPQAAKAVLPEYEKSCDKFLEAVSSAALNTKVQYEHPWFGLLNASGWHALAGSHMSIHRRQIERILSAETTSSPVKTNE